MQQVRLIAMDVSNKASNHQKLASALWPTTANGMLAHVNPSADSQTATSVPSTHPACQQPAAVDHQAWVRQVHVGAGRQFAEDCHQFEVAQDTVGVAAVQLLDCPLPLDCPLHCVCPLPPLGFARIQAALAADTATNSGPITCITLTAVDLGVNGVVELVPGAWADHFGAAPRS